MALNEHNIEVPLLFCFFSLWDISKEINLLISFLSFTKHYKIHHCLFISSKNILFPGYETVYYDTVPYSQQTWIWFRSWICQEAAALFYFIWFPKARLYPWFWKYNTKMISSVNYLQEKCCRYLSNKVLLLYYHCVLTPHKWLTLSLYLKYFFFNPNWGFHADECASHPLPLTQGLLLWKLCYLFCTFNFPLSCLAVIGAILGTESPSLLSVYHFTLCSSLKANFLEDIYWYLSQIPW